MKFNETLGSSHSAGIKALILDKGEVPFVKTLGISSMPGTHALVGMQLTQVRHLKYARNSHFSRHATYSGETLGISSMPGTHT